MAACEDEDDIDRMLAEMPVEKRERMLTNIGVELAELDRYSWCGNAQESIGTLREIKRRLLALKDRLPS